MAAPIVTQQSLKEILHYDSLTGFFTWLERPSHQFKTPGYCRRWNGRHAHTRAGSPNGSGYIQIEINADAYLAHHLAWLYMTGEWGIGQIDHKNHIRDDNRIDNLRDIPMADNRKNRSLNCNNSSSISGVRWCTERNKWRCYIGSKPKVYLGAFDDLFEASCKRKSAEVRMGYHENHGKVLHSGQ